MTAALITPETANEMRERGLEKRFEKKNKEIDELKVKLAQALGPKTEDDLRRKERLLLQVKRCDEMIDDCDDPKTFNSLVNSKARLWELFNPKPGVLKQSRRERPSAPQPIPAPLDTSSPTPPANEDWKRFTG